MRGRIGGMLIFFVIAGGPLLMVVAWYLAYWLESGNRVRFSLRTLLVATTLVALLLGLVVWGLRA